MIAVIQDSKPIARIIECSEEDYFNDPCEVPSLSQSIAHTMVALSPLHAWTIHPRLGKQQEAEDDDTKAKVDGKILHRLLLGKGADIVVCRFNDFRSSAARDMRDEALAAGKVPVIEHRYAEAAAGAEFLREKLSARGYALDGQSEVAFEWDEIGEHGPVRCRGRMDHIKLGTNAVQILDPKKIKSADPQTISRHFYQYGYDIQWRAYTSAMQKFRPDLNEQDIDMVFLFMEFEPPFAITDVRPSPAFQEIGRQRWERAVLLWERCLRTNTWPEYCDRPLDIEPQVWVMNQEIGSEW